MDRVVKVSDRVDVVRCRDCANWYKGHCAHGVCATEETDGDFYCADGERRESDG